MKCSSNPFDILVLKIGAQRINSKKSAGIRYSRKNFLDFIDFRNVTVGLQTIACRWLVCIYQPLNLILVTDATNYDIRKVSLINDCNIDYNLKLRWLELQNNLPINRESIDLVSHTNRLGFSPFNNRFSLETVYFYTKLIVFH